MTYTATTQCPYSALGLMGRFMKLTPEQEALKAAYLALPGIAQKAVDADARESKLDYFTGAMVDKARSNFSTVSMDDSTEDDALADTTKSDFA